MKWRDWSGGEWFALGFLCGGAVFFAFCEWLHLRRERNRRKRFNAHVAAIIEARELRARISNPVKP